MEKSYEIRGMPRRRIQESVAVGSEVEDTPSPSQGHIPDEKAKPTSQEYEQIYEDSEGNFPIRIVGAVPVGREVEVFTDTGVIEPVTTIITSTSAGETENSEEEKQRSLSLDALFQAAHYELENMSKKGEDRKLCKQTSEEKKVDPEAGLSILRVIPTSMMSVSDSSQGTQKVTLLQSVDGTVLNKPGSNVTRIIVDSSTGQMKLGGGKPGVDVVYAQSADGVQYQTIGREADMTTLLANNPGVHTVIVQENSGPVTPGRKRKHPQKPGKHICPYCSKGCTKPSVLQKHIRAHTGERPYPCNVCGISFKTKSNLYKHGKSRTHAFKAGASSASSEGSEAKLSVDISLEDSDGNEEMDIDGDESDGELVTENEVQSSPEESSSLTMLSVGNHKPRLCRQKPVDFTSVSPNPDSALPCQESSDEACTPMVKVYESPSKTGPVTFAIPTKNEEDGIPVSITSAPLVVVRNVDFSESSSTEITSQSDKIDRSFLNVKKENKVLHRAKSEPMTRAVGFLKEQQISSRPTVEKNENSVKVTIQLPKPHSAPIRSASIGDPRNMTPEQLKDRISWLISNNAAIVDTPMAEAPRPKRVSRQTSENLHVTGKPEGITLGRFLSVNNAIGLGLPSNNSPTMNFKPQAQNLDISQPESVVVQEASISTPKIVAKQHFLELAEPSDQPPGTPMLETSSASSSTPQEIKIQFKIPKPVTTTTTTNVVAHPMIGQPAVQFPGQPIIMSQQGQVLLASPMTPGQQLPITPMSDLLKSSVKAPFLDGEANRAVQALKSNSPDESLYGEQGLAASREVVIMTDQTVVGESGDGITDANLTCSPMIVELVNSKAPPKRGRPKGSKNRPKVYRQSSTPIVASAPFNQSPILPSGLRILNVQGNSESSATNQITPVSSAIPSARPQLKLNISRAKALATNTTEMSTPIMSDGTSTPGNKGNNTPKVGETPDWKLKLKGRLLMKRSMSVERMLRQQSQEREESVGDVSDGHFTTTASKPSPLANIYRRSESLDETTPFKKRKLVHQPASIDLARDEDHLRLQNSEETMKIINSNEKTPEKTPESQIIVKNQETGAVEILYVNMTEDIEGTRVILTGADDIPLQKENKPTFIVPNNNEMDVILPGLANMSPMNLDNNIKLSSHSHHSINSILKCGNDKILKMMQLVENTGPMKGLTLNELTKQFEDDSESNDISENDTPLKIVEKENIDDKMSTDGNDPQESTVVSLKATNKEAVADEQLEKDSEDNVIVKFGNDVVNAPGKLKKKALAALLLLGHSYASLQSTGHVSFCSVLKPQPMYVPQGSNTNISMYSNWRTASYNPNPMGLSTRSMLNLYRTQLGETSPIFITAKDKESKEGIITHSSYWQYTHKDEEAEKKENVPLKVNIYPDIANITSSKPQGDNISSEDDIKVEKKEDEVDKPRIIMVKHKPAEPPRVPLFPGGYRSNEDYVYIRGRGRGRYVCESCGIRCRKPSMLKKHIRTHTDLRPYQCKYCNFSFKTKGNLTKHMKSKTHQRKCMQLGIYPVPTSVDDSHINSGALALQTMVARGIVLSPDADMSMVEQYVEVEEDVGGDEDEDEYPEDDEMEMEEEMEEVEEEEVDTADMMVIEEPGHIISEGIHTPHYVAVQHRGENLPSLVELSTMHGTTIPFNPSLQILQSSHTKDGAPRASLDKEIAAASLLDLSKGGDQPGRKEDDEAADGDENKGDPRLHTLIGALRTRTHPDKDDQSSSDTEMTIIKIPDNTKINPMAGILPNVIAFTKQPSVQKDDPSFTGSGFVPPSFFAASEGSEMPISIKKATGSILRDQLAKVVGKKGYVTIVSSAEDDAVEMTNPTETGAIAKRKATGNILREELVKVVKQDRLVTIVSSEEDNAVEVTTDTETDVTGGKSTDGVMQVITLSGSDPIRIPLNLVGLHGAPTAVPSQIPLGVKLLSSVSTCKSSDSVQYVTGENCAPYEIVPIPIKVNDSATDFVDGKYVCNVCSKVFTKQHQLTNHKNIHYFERPFKCADCGLSFRTKGHLDKHLRSESHTSKQTVKQQLGVALSDDPRPYKCEDCSIAFRIPGHLAKHIRSKAHIATLERLEKLPSGTYSKVEACHTGNDALLEHLHQLIETASTTSSMQSESITHQPESQSTDALSPMSAEESPSQLTEDAPHDHTPPGLVTVAATAQPLNVTVAVPRSVSMLHRPSIPYVTPSASTTTTTTSVASSAQVIVQSIPSAHDQQFVYQLEEYEKDDQASNERVTVEIKSEPIDLGDIGTEADTGTETEAPASGAVGGQLRCGLCTKTFRELESLKNHLLSHAEPRPFVCEFCEAGFPREKSLKFHLLTHSQERPYICGNCGESFVNSSEMKTHLAQTGGRCKGRVGPGQQVVLVAQPQDDKESPPHHTQNTSPHTVAAPATHQVLSSVTPVSHQVAVNTPVKCSVAAGVSPVSHQVISSVSPGHHLISSVSPVKPRVIPVHSPVIHQVVPSASPIKQRQFLDADERQVISSPQRHLLKGATIGGGIMEQAGEVENVNIRQRNTTQERVLVMDSTQISGKEITNMGQIGHQDVLQVDDDGKFKVVQMLVIRSHERDTSSEPTQLSVPIEADVPANTLSVRQASTAATHQQRAVVLERSHSMGKLQRQMSSEHGDIMVGVSTDKLQGIINSTVETDIPSERYLTQAGISQSVKSVPVITRSHTVSADIGRTVMAAGHHQNRVITALPAGGGPPTRTVQPTTMNQNTHD